MEESLKIGVISLGCAKNRVDTEVMLGLLKEAGHTFVQDMASADVILINTCTFIGDAREEAFGTILEAGQQKRYGNVKGIVVAGCLPQHFGQRLRTMVPEVDVFLGTSGYKNVVDAVRAASCNQRTDMISEPDLGAPFDKRILTTMRPTAYVKIAEGCDNCCSYCVIPTVRGRFQSRKMEDIFEEVTLLALQGYSEIILVAQDTTKYGTDIYGKESLPALLDQLATVPGVRWLRVLYTYPESITDELLDVMTKHDNIVRYLDVPIQHMSDDILERMNRNTTKESIMDTLKRIRSADDDFVIRSTVIVGFPGETKKDFSVLQDGIREAEFDRLGVFPYSREEGTPAARMEDQIDPAVKESRHDSIMNEQAPISYEHNRKRIGKVYDVLIEGYDPKARIYYGRSYAEAPDVDGLIFIRSEKELPLQDFCKVRIVQALNYDCLAEPAE